MSANTNLNEQSFSEIEVLSLDRFKSLKDEAGMIILDTRPATVFTAGFIPGSVSIGLEGNFTEWAGALLPFLTPLLLVAEPGKENEVAHKLRKTGFSNIKGILDGGFETWLQSGETVDLIIDVEADELAMDIPFDQNLVVIDVRRETEFGDGHVVNALNIPLDELQDPGSLADFEDHHNLYLHCKSGYRSVIAASLIKRQGIHNIRNVLGGFEQIRLQGKIGLSKENSVLN